MPYPKCTTILQITDGETTIDLYEARRDGMAPARDGGVSPLTYAPHQRDQFIQSMESSTWLETITLNHRAYSADDLAEQAQALSRMLRKAWQYNNKPSRYGTPVYLIAKAFGETNERFALVEACQDVTGPNALTDEAFRQAIARYGIGVQVRRFAWGDLRPGDIGTAKTLGQVNGGPTNMTVLANHYDDHSISVIKVDDGGVFGANLFGNAGAINLFPAAPAVNDALYIGSTQPFFHVVFWLTQAAAHVGATFVYELSDGAAGWPDLTLGDNLALYPEADPWVNTGLVVINNFVHGVSWATEAVDGDSLFWLRVRVSAIATSFTTPPANGIYPIYNQRSPQIRIPAGSVAGDGPPMALLRFETPAGGVGTCSPANLSRILLGSKTQNLDAFNSHLNCGNDGMPAGWAVTYGDDTSAVANAAAPGGDRADCSFATDTAWDWRVRFTGTNMLEAYRGEYRPFLICQQSGGAVGDIEVRLRVSIGSTDAYAPVFETPEVALTGLNANNAFKELLDLYPQNTIKFPFHNTRDDDALDATDLIIEIWATRSTAGAAVLRAWTLVLIPTDEWSIELDDPISSEDTGNSALRGDCALDCDGGLIDERVLKYINVGGSLIPAEGWVVHGYPLRLDPNKDTYIYGLMAHFPLAQDWNVAPLCASTGMMAKVSLYLRNIYYELRGAG